MQIYILDSEYNRIGLVDEAESILWNKKYNDVGECEIYIPCDTAYIDILKKRNYIYRPDDDMFCKIEDVAIETDAENGDYLIATGKDICNILSGRIVRWQISFSGKVSWFLYTVLLDNIAKPQQGQRAISKFEIDTSNFDEFTETIDTTTANEDVLQLIISTCKTYNYGFRLSYDMGRGKLVFRLYKGKNKASITGAEYVEFSPQFANILSTSYKDSDSNYKNIAYVGYKGVDEQTHLLSVFNTEKEPQGEERREIYVDGTSVSRDITYAELLVMFPTVQKESKTVTEGETKKVTSEYYITDAGGRTVVATSEGEGEEEKITVSDYTYLILEKTLGLNTLAEHKPAQEFSGSVDFIDTYEYKTDYDLGDIVKAVNEYGIEAPARIVSVLESDDNEDGYVIEPTYEFIN